MEEKIKNYQQRYKSCKNILEILESGDVNDPRLKMLMLMSIEEVEAIQEFVKQCEDLGFQYLYESN